ncbi:GDP-mannose 4,6-dehydratase [Nakamurella leprariae]|uniref:GDP-mannose 4,6-dehydratase n=1 Tax=Nakamurella leprariae TaxID=2803911 RepID=A0A938YJ86_9ACTN|nr:GDP-mannose 4,6-dehydratase [Nakamurella leprariae]MBM9469154.1 GDP-mannose 4,6-dehydratase [Nakamurella leprariae]
MTVALVTGVAGQDGGYLAQQLLAAGTEVHGLVHRPLEALLPTRPWLAEITCHRGDVTDTEGTAALIRELRPDRIFNLAGDSSVGRSWRTPERTGAVCGVAVPAMLAAAGELADRGRDVRFVQASSAEIFGNPAQPRQDERTPIQPINPYGAAKAYAHVMCRIYRDRGLHVSSMVLYPHESPRRSPAFVSRTITAGVVDIVRGRRDHLELGNVSARRDWGWAPEVVQAMIRAAEQPVGDDYVIATGVAHSVEEFVARAFAEVGIADWRPLVRTDPARLRPRDAAELCGDAGRARLLLAWHPTVGFDELVRRLVDAALHASTQAPLAVLT